MEYTEEQKAEFRRLFSTRRRNQIILAVPIILVILLLPLAERNEAIFGVPPAVVGPVGLVLILGALAFSLYNWRCPACNKYLGKAISPKFCSRCGVELT